MDLKESGLCPLNRKTIRHRILITEIGNNQEHSTRIDPSTTIVSSEAQCLSTHLYEQKNHPTPYSYYRNRKQPRA
ncbi:hypothetical protein TNCV_4456401 [Trichonephila clavipes]|nr:hypothetical protein TNCV_4456401 [Trichonephila clavipes]